MLAHLLKLVLYKVVFEKARDIDWHFRRCASFFMTTTTADSTHFILYNFNVYFLFLETVSGEVLNSFSVSIYQGSKKPLGKTGLNLMGVNFTLIKHLPRN